MAVSNISTSKARQFTLQRQITMLLTSTLFLSVLLSCQSSEEKARLDRKNAIIWECATIAAKARSFYRKPVALGGGGHSFYGFAIPENLKRTENAGYAIRIKDKDAISIIATGTTSSEPSPDAIRVFLNLAPPLSNGELLIADEKNDVPLEEMGIGFLGESKFFFTDASGDEVEIAVSKQAQAQQENERFRDINRSALSNECVAIASRAQAHFRTPKQMGGGSNSFLNFKIPRNMAQTNSGTFRLGQLEKEQVMIVGIGKEIGNDGVKPVEVRVTVTPSELNTRTIN